MKNYSAQYRLFEKSLVICADYFSGECGELIDAHFGERAFGVVTADPPYGQIVKKDWDERSERETVELYEKTTRRVRDSDLAPGGTFAIWWGIGKLGCRPGYRFAGIAESRFELEQLEHVTWRKRRAYGTQTRLLFTREELSVYRRRGEQHTFNVPHLEKERGYAGYNKKYPARSSKLRRTNVWDDVTELFKGKIHDCEKPVRLYEIIYQTWGDGRPVLDIYAGSGAAAEAALNLGLQFCVVESDPAAYDVICSRLSRWSR